MVFLSQEKNSPLLKINNLKTYFFLDEGTLKAVDGVDLEIKKGKTLGLVGESGCGKSVTAFSILRIISPPGKLIEGDILLYRENGEKKSPLNLAKLSPSGEEIRSIRGKEITMIFQEPMTSFSPVHTIGDQIMEAILLHRTNDKKEAREITLEMLAKVGIPNPVQRIDEYPHQLSGGMRQRAMIAMAISCRPDLLIADEPTTNLDVTIQAQILDLMNQLQKEFNVSIMLITHDLGVLSEFCQKIAIMYAGNLLEFSDAETLFEDPKHPYTEALLQSIPKFGFRGKRLEAIPGKPPSLINPPRGCKFHPRCKYKMDGICDKIPPPLIELDSGVKVACHKYSKS